MKRVVLIAVLSLAVTALLIAAIQCDGGSASVPTRPAGAAPVKSPAGGAYPVATGEPVQPTPTGGTDAYPAPSLDVEKLLSERCGATCHDLGRVTSAKKTEAEWQATVDRMIAKGARLTKEETATLVKFLARVYR